MRIFFITPFIIFFIGLYGWIWNIVKIIGSLDDPTVTPMFIARCVGTVAAPIGAILGFF